MSSDNVDPMLGDSDLRQFSNPGVIIGVDPGVTTGLSMIGFDRDKKFLEQPLVVALDQLDTRSGEPEACKIIADLVRNAPVPPERVFMAIEDFIIRKPLKTREFLSPVRVTAGVVQELYTYLPQQNVMFFTPAQAKTTCTNERLEAWGLIQSVTLKYRDRHSLDSLRQATLALRKLT